MKCSVCQNEKDHLRVLTDHPFWGICKQCRDKIDSEYIELEQVEPKESDKCSCCGSKEELRASGYGGYRNPTYSFTCQNCRDESQAEYENQLISAEYYLITLKKPRKHSKTTYYTCHT